MENNHKIECSFPGCGRKRAVKYTGLCVQHTRQRKAGIELTEIRQWDHYPAICKVGDCGKPSVTKGICAMHRSRFEKYGDLGPAGNLVGTWGVNNNGYVFRRITVDGIRINILQHREVMEEHLGRKLYPGENVHHLDGDKQNNKIGNLELWAVSQPPGQRVSDRTAWAIEWLKTYAPELLK